MVGVQQVHAGGENVSGPKDAFANGSDDAKIVTSVVGIASIFLVSRSVPFPAAVPLPPIRMAHRLTFAWCCVQITGCVLSVFRTAVPLASDSPLTVFSEGRALEIVRGLADAFPQRTVRRFSFASVAFLMPVRLNGCMHK